MVELKIVDSISYVGLESIGSVAFSPDGKTIAAGSYDEEIRLWESTAPADGYQARRDGATARELVAELHKEHALYSEVTSRIKAIQPIDESVRKVALQIANARLWEDKERAQETDR